MTRWLVLGSAMFLLTALALDFLPSPGSGGLADGTLPIPTEVVKAKRDRRLYRNDRDAWFESLHQAPAGVSWQDVERDNALQGMARRTAYVRGTSRLDLPPELSKAQWTSLGSKNLSGRINVSALGLDGKTIYAGAPNGVWVYSGSAWSPLNDVLRADDLRAIVPLKMPAGVKPKAVVKETAKKDPLKAAKKAAAAAGGGKKK